MSSLVSELIIYPVKSLGGISVSQSKALYAGFEHDRRWMLLDEHNTFITQREIPQLALFKPTIEDDDLVISYQNQALKVGKEQRTSDTIITKVWDDAAATVRVGKDADEWFSDLLRRKVKMVRIKSDHGRQHHNKNKDINISVSLADGYPFLVTGSASLDLLNSKLISPVPMNRFRPNIVLSTLDPHEEDSWDNCRVGEVNFLNMKPCGRCSIVTIDQNNATINNETLKILNTYRKSGNSVLFGTNMICTNEGVIRVGDEWFY